MYITWGLMAFVNSWHVNTAATFYIAQLDDNQYDTALE
jgi:hypothetical protein